MKNFQDKVLVVTGAAHGIGKAIAQEGARRKMKLVLNDIDEMALESTVKEIREEFNSDIVFQVGDITLVETIEGLHEMAMKTFGKVHILVNNAGIAISTPVWEIPTRDIQWITEANYLSHAYGMRIFLPDMINNKEEAAIINTASAAGLIVTGSAGLYHGSKTADVTLAESTAIGLKQRHIDHVTIHALCPAFVQTDLYSSENHRPERYAKTDDPYYTGQEYLSSLYRTEQSVKNGMTIDSIGMTVFTALEEKKFYILTHPEILVATKQKYENLMNFRNPY